MGENGENREKRREEEDEGGEREQYKAIYNGDEAGAMGWPERVICIGDV